MTNIALVVATVLLLGSPVSQAVPAPAPSAPSQAAVTVPDTPPGRGLQGFISSFNEGGDKRREWLTSATTMDAGNVANIYQQDVDVLAEHGPMTIVRLPKEAMTATSMVAIVHHAKTGVHGHLTIEVQADAPHKVTNMGLRGATPEEIKGL